MKLQGDQKILKEVFQWASSILEIVENEFESMTYYSQMSLDDR